MIYTWSFRWWHLTRHFSSMLGVTHSRYGRLLWWSIASFFWGRFFYNYCTFSTWSIFPGWRDCGFSCTTSAGGLFIIWEDCWFPKVGSSSFLVWSTLLLSSFGGSHHQYRHRDIWIGFNDIGHHRDSFSIQGMHLTGTLVIVSSKGEEHHSEVMDQFLHWSISHWLTHYF